MSYCYTKEYRDKHRFCPKCGCVRISQQLACCQGDIDDNGAFCNCGWKGIVHDLLAIRPPKACSCERCVQLIIDGEFEQ